MKKINEKGVLLGSKSAENSEKLRWNDGHFVKQLENASQVKWKQWRKRKIFGARNIAHWLVVAHERSFLQIRAVKQSDDGTSMDTTSAAAAPAGEGSAFGAVHIKQEPGGQSDESPLSRGTEGDGPRTIRKITVLDPLKLKLLSRQNHNKLLSGLSAGNFCVVNLKRVAKQ